MKRIVRYFITYPIWANTLMAAILVAGWISLNRIKTSFFPEVETNRITISVSYPGTSPEEIEEALVLKIENNLRGIAGIDRTSSQSRENNASVTVEVQDTYDVEEVYDDVKNAVDRISPWPAGAERPVVLISKFRSRAVSLALYGDADLWALKERAEDFRDELLRFPEISQVSIEGIPSREIAVTVSEENLRAYNLTFDEIASAIAAANVDVSGGSIKTATEQLLIRAYGRRDYAHEIRSLVLRGSSDGAVVRIGDVAEVAEQWEDSPDATYYNGKRAVIVNVDKTIEEDILAISRRVNTYAEEFKARHPELSVAVTRDASISLRERIGLLVKNGAFGFVLVLLTLSVFLNRRLSFWVAAGIPISFAGMFVIANLWGITINVISLMGMIIVVGILVDDAIVVAESIYQKHEQGESPLKAAVQGLFEVIAPVFTAVSTTILAFLPFFFFQGTFGKIIYQLALVVIGTLMFSLVESFFILPAHLAHSKGLDPQANTGSLRRRFDGFYRFLTDRLYGPALAWSLKNTWIVVAVPLAWFMVSLGLIRGGLVEFSSRPFIDRDDITLNLTMTTGTREHVTDSILAAVEAQVWEVNNEIGQSRSDKRDVVLDIVREIGGNSLGDRGGHAGNLRIELLEGEVRKMRSFELANRLRRRIGVIPGAQKLSMGGGRWGKPVSISLMSNDLENLDKAKAVLKDLLSEYTALSDITDSDIEGWREVRLSLKPAATAEGLTVRDIAGQVRRAFFGHEVQRFQRGEDEIRVWVRYDAKDRAALGNLEDMYIRTPGGGARPLSTLADYTIRRGRVVISHLDGRREVRVEADMVDPEASVTSVINDIRKNAIPVLMSRVEGVHVSFEGGQRNDVVFNRSLRRAFPPALAAIVVILVLVFRSPLQMLIIVLMIPLGLMGAVWGHLFHGFLISRLSTFGVIALVGIVINDSIVFIDRINRNLKSGMPVIDAVHGAGLSRLRPIILTTVTTIAGMAPLILEGSRQARFLQPMAVSLSYGLMFGSLCILFVVPVLFVGLNRARLAWGRFLGKNATAESVEPAVREIASEKEAGEL